MLLFTFLIPSLFSASSRYGHSFFSMAASASTANSRSGEGVLICLSKANNHSDKSVLYVAKLEDDRIGEANPVHLMSPRGRTNLWRNADLRREKLSFSEIVKFRIVENEYVYDGKTGKQKMVSYSKLPWKRLLLLNI